MKVLILSDNNIFTPGGSQKSIYTMATSMVKKNIEVGIFMPEGDVNDDESSIDYMTFKDTKAKSWIFRNIFKFTKKVKKIEKCIKEYNPDIIHAQNPTAGLLLLLLLKKHKIINKKTIYTDRDFLGAYSNFYFKHFTKYANLFDLIITTTDANNNEWNKKTNAKKVVTVPNVLEDYWFDYNKDTERELKEKSNIQDKMVVSFSGRYVRYKRWDNVYKICSNLKDVDNIHFLFAFIKDESKEYSDYKKQLKQLLGNKVDIIENADYKKMVEFYYKSDCFILTSDKESFGRTIIEAMTKGNVVIGTNSGGVPSIITDKKYLYEVDDINKPINIIKNLTKEKIDKIKEVNFNYSKEKYTVNNMSEKMYKVYNDINNQ